MLFDELPLWEKKWSRPLWTHGVEILLLWYCLVFFFIRNTSHYSSNCKKVFGMDFLLSPCLSCSIHRVQFNVYATDILFQETHKELTDTMATTSGVLGIKVDDLETLVLSKPIKVMFRPLREEVSVFATQNGSCKISLMVVCPSASARRIFFFLKR